MNRMKAIRGDDIGWKYCEHGKCVDHDPEWDISEEYFAPRKGLFGGRPLFKRGVFERCCGRGMVKMDLRKTYRCKKCGAVEDRSVNNDAWRCDCCGKQYAVEFYAI